MVNLINRHYRRDTYFTWVLLLVLGICWLSQARSNDDLPLLGENSAINIEQEYKIGAKFYRRLLEEGVIETDPILDGYINELGARLLSGIENRVRDYTFFIVKDFGVNAFAVPGGFILSLIHI